MGSSSELFGPETRIANLGAGATITMAGIGAAVAKMVSSSRSMAFRFELTGASGTIGDGTSANAIAIIGRRDFTLNKNEMIGFAGITIGGSVPQLPLVDAGGANARSFTQIVAMADGYAWLGIAGFSAAGVVPAGGTLAVYVSEILDQA